MLEVTTVRKNKINLADYALKQDIENRILMSDFSPFDLKVLEEILFSALKISLKKLAKTLNAEDKDLQTILSKLAKTGLLSLSGDSITVDKEMRKYFEFQIQRFDADFHPDMEFVQALLRRVPIHVLPTWYSIPRSSNNIFESLIEKYLLTPQIFTRYLTDLQLPDPRAIKILKEVLASDTHVLSSDLIERHNLSRPDFEEIMLLLEFSFVCAVRYIKEDDHWLEIVTPYHEWQQYNDFLKRTETPTHIVKAPKKSEFAFIEEMVQTLKKPQKGHPLEKLQLLKLIDESQTITEAGRDWLESSLENKALYLYRHPYNRLLSLNLPTNIGPIHEAEKSIRRILHGNWVKFDEFLKGVFVSLTDDKKVTLRKTGKSWQYQLPTYSPSDIQLIHAAIFEWLYECGIVKTHGDHFALTSFGRNLFAD
jgi:hypothetical protein